MPESNIRPGDVGSLVIEQEIAVAAPRAKVFAALTGDVGAWWGRPYIQDVDEVVSIVIEPELGGRFLERWGDGDGAVWCVVTTFRRDRCLILQGTMAMPGAVFGSIRFDLEDGDGDGTLLKLSHHAIGEVTDDLRQGYDAGWSDLLGRRLKTWVETGERLGLGHEPAEDER